VASTGLAVWRIDRFGRRAFFLAGLTLMAASAALLVGATATLQKQQHQQQREGEAEEGGEGSVLIGNSTGSSDSTDGGSDEPGDRSGGDGGSDDSGGGEGGGSLARGLVVLGCMGYTVAYQLSFGPGVFILGGEMFPPPIRGRLLGAQTLWGALCLAVTSELFPALVASLGLPATFGLHLAFTLAAGLFVAFGLVETRGKSPEQTRKALEDKLFGWSHTADLLCCPDPPDDDGGDPTTDNTAARDPPPASSNGANDNKDDINNGRGCGGGDKRPSPSCSSPSRSSRLSSVRVLASPEQHRGTAGRRKPVRPAAFEMAQRDEPFSADLV
jgi:hypothetical protein